MKTGRTPSVTSHLELRSGAARDQTAVSLEVIKKKKKYSDNTQPILVLNRDVEYKICLQ